MDAQGKKRGSLFVLLAIAALIGLALATQRSVAAAIGGWLTGVWVGSMDIVLRLFGAAMPG